MQSALFHPSHDNHAPDIAWQGQVLKWALDACFTSASSLEAHTHGAPVSEFSLSLPLRRRLFLPPTTSRHPLSDSEEEMRCAVVKACVELAAMTVDEAVGTRPSDKHGPVLFSAPAFMCHVLTTFARFGWHSHEGADESRMEALLARWTYAGVWTPSLRLGLACLLSGTGLDVLPEKDRKMVEALWA